jgi:hypothetical protein
VHMLGTGLNGGGDRSDRCELKLLQLPCFQVVCMHSSRGRCIGSGGACMCAGGLFVVFRAWFWWSTLFALALFCLRCVEPLPLPKGSETCLLQVILFFAFVWLSIVCWSFFLFVSFFPFLSCYFVPSISWTMLLLTHLGLYTG